MTAAVFAVLLAAAPARAVVLPTRAAQPGCAWKQLNDAHLGLSMPYQKCDLGFRTIDYEWSAKEGRVWEVVTDTAPGSKPQKEAVVLMFTKAPAEKIETAIKRVAAPLAPAARRAHCRAAPAKDAGLLEGKLAFSYAPDDEDKLVDEAGGDVPEAPCGDYGMDFDSQLYFEYHPAENPRRFALVLVGQDEPLFDEKSLRFLP